MGTKAPTQRRTGDLRRWREAGRRLRERGRFAWALGWALEEALGDVGVGSAMDPFAVLAAIVDRVTGFTPGAGEEARDESPRGLRRPASATNARPVAPGPDESAWCTLQHTPLGEAIWLVVWFGAAVTPEPGLTLALGMREDGRRQILGLWTGSPTTSAAPSSWSTNCTTAASAVGDRGSPSPAVPPLPATMG